MTQTGTQRWTRRQMLAAAGMSAGAGALRNTFGSSLWATEQIKACTLTPELEVGPYYAPYELVRSDIREDRPGVPLRFTLELRNAKTCAPVPNAAVDIWHCDALGVYSGFTKVPTGMFGGEGGPGGPPPDGAHHGPPPGFGGPHPRGDDGGPPAAKQTDQETFLRGVQVTDGRGRVSFQTIFPGWYMGRDTHIHMEVHIGGTAEAGTARASDAAHTAYPKYGGGHVCHVGQIAFPDELSDGIGKLEPYRQHTITRTRLQEDHVFQGDPREYMMHLRQLDQAQVQAGLSGTITVFVDPEITPKPVGGGPGGRPPGPPPEGNGQ